MIDCDAMQFVAQQMHAGEAILATTKMECDLIVPVEWAHATSLLRKFGYHGFQPVGSATRPQPLRPVAVATVQPCSMANAFISCSSARQSRKTPDIVQ